MRLKLLFNRCRLSRAFFGNKRHSRSTSHVLFTITKVDADNDVSFVRFSFNSLNVFLYGSANFDTKFEVGLSVFAMPPPYVLFCVPQ